MSLDRVRRRILDAINDGAEKSGIDLAGLPQPEKDRFFEEITNSVLLAFDSYISESADSLKSNSIATEMDETIIWKGRPFLSLTESYIITSERIKVITGFISRKVENFELIRIQDIDYKQDVGERIMNLGDITIRGHDSSDPHIVLKNISKPEVVYEMLRRSWLLARKKHGLQFREYM
jgi:hypothetical protein